LLPRVGVAEPLVGVSVRCSCCIWAVCSTGVSVTEKGSFSCAWFG
jgi:hypothetical protein